MPSYIRFMVKEIFTLYIVEGLVPEDSSVLSDLMSRMVFYMQDHFMFNCKNFTTHISP